MSNKYWILFFVFLINLTLVNAAEIDFKFSKENYKSFETLQAEINLNVNLTKDLTFSNVVLFDKNNNAISVAKTLIKIDNTHYYVYFDLPSLESGNYLFGLNSVNYNQNSKFLINNFYTGLTVVDGNSQILSIRPGFIKDELKEFGNSYSLILNNKGTDLITINFTSKNSFISFDRSEVLISPASSKIVTASILDNFNANDIIVINYGNQSSYSINVFIPSTAKMNETNEIQAKDDFTGVAGFYLSNGDDKIYSTLDLELDRNEKYAEASLFILNNYSKAVHNVNIYLTGDVQKLFNIRPNKIILLDSKSSRNFFMTLKDKKNLSLNEYTGFLNVNSTENAELKIPIKITPYGVIPVKTNQTITLNKTVINNTTPIQTKTTSQTNPAAILLISVAIFLVLFFVAFYFISRKKK
jgi:hypothetical protein